MGDVVTADFIPPARPPFPTIQRQEMQPAQISIQTERQPEAVSRAYAVEAYRPEARPFVAVANNRSDVSAVQRAPTETVASTEPELNQANIPLFATPAEAGHNAEALIVQVQGTAEKYLLFADRAALSRLLGQAELLPQGPTMMAYANAGAAAADTTNIVQILVRQDEEETVVVGFADRQEVSTFLTQAAEWHPDTALDEIARHVYQQLQHQLVIDRERRVF
jgi:hypothetical protein